MAVYGNGLSLKEDDPKEPQSPYGISKLASEKYLKYFCKENKIGLSIMRIFNCYGPGQNTQGNLKGLLNIFIEQLVILLFYYQHSIGLNSIVSLNGLIHSFQKNYKKNIIYLMKFTQKN